MTAELFLYPDPRASNAKQSRGEIQRLRSIRNGDRAAILDAVMERFIAADIKTSGQVTQLASRRNFLVENEIGPIIETRIDEVPQAWEFQPHEEGGDEAFAKALNEWAADTNGIEGSDLFTDFGEILEDQEVDGSAAIVLGRNAEGEVWYAIRDTAQMRVQSDPMNPRTPASVVFEWTVRDGEAEHVYSEEITAEGRTLRVDGVDQAEAYSGYGLPMLPVVIIPRRIRKGSPLGDSGVAELEEAQLAYLWALYLLNKANKYEASGVYCPEPGDDDGALLPDQDGGRVGNIAIEAGMLYPIPIRKVGGSINTQTLQAQVELALQSLRRQGKVREQAEQTSDMRSGKAMLIGSEAMRAYVRRKLLLLKRGLVQLATIWGHLTGRLSGDEQAPVHAEFADHQDDDQAEVTKRAEFWLKVLAAGKITEERFYEQMQRLGMIDEDADPDQLAAEVREREEEESEKAAAAFLSDRQKPGAQPGGTEAMDDDEMPAEGMMAMGEGMGAEDG